MVRRPSQAVNCVTIQSAFETHPLWAGWYLPRKPRRKPSAKPADQSSISGRSPRSWRLRTPRSTVRPRAPWTY
jgi:hypothetical protein